VTGAPPALLLLAALAGAGHAAPPEAAPSVSTAPLERADAALALAEQRLSRLDALLTTLMPGGRDDRCAQITYDRLMDEAAQRKALPAPLGALQDLVVQQAFRYYTCVAAAKKDIGVCGKLAPFDDFARPHPRWECERYSKELRFAYAQMTDAPDIMELCLEDLDHPEDNEFKGQDSRKVCAMVLRDRRKPRVMCGELQRQGLFLKKNQLGKCTAWFSALSGDGSSCEALGENDVKERCVAYAAFVKAREKKDPQLCGDSWICRSFMGGGAQACEPYTERVRPRVCAKLAEVCKTVGDWQQADLQTVDEALAQAGKGPDAEARRRRAAAVQEGYHRIQSRCPRA
jgi:hypothetical protein